MSPRHQSASGFTLLEMIVVLTILGLAGALVLPNLQNLFAAVVQSTDRNQVLDQITGLGAKAVAAGRDLVVWPADGDANAGPLRAASGTYTRHQLQLPPNWRLQLDRPLLVRANGVCMGAAMILIDASGRRHEYDLQAPFCRAP